jgi:pimeloyl-ACP methyl ester carboxylesterase
MPEYFRYTDDMKFRFSWLPFYLNVPVNLRRFQKPTVVMLHGIGASSSIWEQVIDQLDAGHVIAVDLLGFGRSPKPKLLEYTIDDHVMAVRRTLKKRLWRKPIVIVGHSLGCLVAIEYARRWPRDVDRLVLCSPPLYTTSQKAGLRLPRLDDLYIQAYAAARTYRIGERAIRFVGREANITGLLINDTTWPAFAKTLKATIEEQQSMLHIQHLELPIDILYGRFDSFLIEKNIKAIAKRNNNVHLYKIVAPHAITRGYAKRVVKILNTTRR